MFKDLKGSKIFIIFYNAIINIKILIFCVVYIITFSVLKFDNSFVTPRSRISHTVCFHSTSFSQTSCNDLFINYIFSPVRINQYDYIVNLVLIRVRRLSYLCRSLSNSCIFSTAFLPLYLFIQSCLL